MDTFLPIRVRWDVDFHGQAARVKRIARKVAEVCPRFVELRISGDQGVSELPGICAELQKCSPGITVTIGLFPGAESATRWGYPVEFIWDVGALGGFAGRLPGGARAVAFVPEEGTIGELPEIVSEFSESSIRELHLPHVNAVRAVAARGHVPVPGIDQLREAAETVASLGVTLEGKRVVAHDFFLWRELRGRFPAAVGDRVEFAGCEAGSALAFIDWKGNVYPCDALPIRLGNLEEASLEEIWRSPARERVVAAIQASPDPFDACGENRGCLGGCRGMVFPGTETSRRPDPACPMPTESGSSV